MDLIEKVKDTADEALDRSKSAVGENAERINAVIDSVTSTVDARTGGRYRQQISRAAAGAKDQINAFGSKPAGPVVGEPALGEAIPDVEIVE